MQHRRAVRLQGGSFFFTVVPVTGDVCIRVRFRFIQAVLPGC